MVLGWDDLTPQEHREGNIKSYENIRATLRTSRVTRTSGQHQEHKELLKGLQLLLPSSYKDGREEVHRMKGQLPNLSTLPDALQLPAWLRRYLPGSPPSGVKGEADS